MTTGEGESLDTINAECEGIALPVQMPADPPVATPPSDPPPVTTPPRPRRRPGHDAAGDPARHAARRRAADDLPAPHAVRRPLSSRAAFRYVQQAGNSLAVAALVLGIIGVILGLVPILFFLARILGILALVLGLVARSRAQKQPQVGRKTMATWGAVLGAAAIALGVVGVVIVADVFEDVETELNDVSECIENADTPEELEDC